MAKIHMRKLAITICKQTRQFMIKTQKGKRHLWLSGLTQLLVAEEGVIRLEKHGCLGVLMSLNVSTASDQIYIHLKVHVLKHYLMCESLFLTRPKVNSAREGKGYSCSFHNWS